jgi:hypothetical protein
MQSYAEIEFFNAEIELVWLPLTRQCAHSWEGARTGRIEVSELQSNKQKK